MEMLQEYKNAGAVAETIPPPHIIWMPIVKNYEQSFTLALVKDTIRLCRIILESKVC